MYNEEKNGTTHSVRDEVIRRSWEYLRDNFHKFSPANQLKVSLELSKKSMPTQIEAEVKVVKMPDIKVGGRLAEYHLG